MIKDIAQRLLQDDNIQCGDAVNPCYLTECKQYLADMKYCDIPGEYMTLLRYVNGVRSDNAVLFGICPHDNDTDIIRANEALGVGNQEELALGKTDFDVLFYDAANKDYRVKNSRDLSLAEVFDTLEEALSYWFALKE